MAYTTESLARYLGEKASVLLADLSFKGWTFDRSSDSFGGKSLIDYICDQDGFNFVCDDDDRVRSIFLSFEPRGCFKNEVEDIPRECGRRAVAARLGAPAASAGPYSDAILGQIGVWDRFDRPGYAIHVEFRSDTDAIRRIALMRADAVPLDRGAAE